MLRRIFVQHDSDMFTSDEWWLETVGSSHGFWPIHNQDYPQQRLLCFQDAQGNVLRTGFDLDQDTSDCYNRGFGGDVQRQETKSIRTYPNPARNTLHVEFEGTDNPQGTLTVTNITGVVMFTRECHDPVTKLDVSHLAPGLYVVSFRNEKGVMVRKFVKL